MTSVPEPDDGPPPLSVGDPVLGKSRLLARQCGTCIFHPGNRMHLAPGRLKQIVDEAVTEGSYVICHATLPYGEHPEVQPAICRGFADRYTTWRLQVIARLFGFVEVPPPGEPASTTTENSAD
ncbi:hypothetical protein Dvina_51510 [Dactylosporangium vinaceum]|uniref:Uncharacterized protein n=1 Tax=Dactylosporangium vinaceum TaxID=53362 RepID=A0ABV5M2G3_9ACTN|nr:hypothetical protein [Dactylosporangium vinaceum]UAB96275.1 hypothetical protein Dvina_51510 [Dactylosporangium vinaceum]